MPQLKSGAFVLDKHLPAAAGIGGGSADAAATLRLLAGANDLAPDDPRLIAAAQAAGADVPVCLLSSGCMMRGAGERVTPMPLPRLPCVLINPGVPVPTKDVFAAIGLKPGDAFAPPAGGTDDVAWPPHRRSSDDWLVAIARGRNDLEPVAVKIQPVIAEVLSLLREAKGCTLVAHVGLRRDMFRPVRQRCVGGERRGVAEVAASEVVGRGERVELTASTPSLRAKRSNPARAKRAN